MNSFRKNILSKHLIHYPLPGIFFIIPGIVMTLVLPFFLQNSFFQEVDASHCVQYYPEISTIGISCGVADLFDVADQVASETILSQESRGVWVLKANIVIGNSAILNINSTYVDWLKIDPSGDPPYHITVLGNLTVDSVKISSCNATSTNNKQNNGTAPRPYITMLYSATGTLSVKDSELSCLGYNFPQREGLSIYGGTGYS